jgi:hypothetical protein
LGRAQRPRSCDKESDHVTRAWRIGHTTVTRAAPNRLRDYSLKYWLEVSPEEQTRRLEARIDDGQEGNGI